MRKPHLIICIGPPASGKSDAVKKFLKNKPSFIKLSRDDIRFMLRDSYGVSDRTEKLITQMEITSLEIAISKEFDVIVDDTNVLEKYVNRLIKGVKEYVDITYWVFDTDFDVCIERNNLRTDGVRVSDESMQRMFKNYENLKNTFLKNKISDIIWFNAK
jgi:tRNA uridine 5-carbamoylmethylation protein Kti12